MDSSQVRLEVAILAGDQAAASTPATADKRRTILVIGADEALRESVRETLGARDDVRIVIAPTVAKLLALAKVDEEIAKLLG